MRNCKQCRRNIVARNAHAQFCSTKCRVAAHRKLKKTTIPTELIQNNRWVRWDSQKRPLTVDGHSASSTNPETWATYDEVKQSNAGIGIGYVLGNGIGCIDIDHCFIDGKITSATRAIVNRYPGNYIETSPSGNGLHIWGILPEQPGTRNIDNGVHIETYSRGRYITITGNVYQPGTLLPLGDANPHV
jgi:primase-polymerase (primpol)-like protein